MRGHVHSRELGVDRPMGSPCVYKDRRTTRQGDADCPVSVPEYGVTTWVQAAVEVDRAGLRLHKRVPPQACRDRRDGPVVRDGADLAPDVARVDGSARRLQRDGAADVGRRDRSVGVVQHEIAGEASCLERTRRDVDIRARVPWYRHLEVHPRGRREATADRDGDGNHISLLPVASVNGTGEAAPVLCDADLAIRPGPQMHTPRRVDQPQHHLVANREDRRAWCWMARGGRRPCRDDEHDDGQQQGTHERQPPRTPPRRRDVGLHQRGKGARRCLAAYGCEGGGTACEYAAESGLSTGPQPCPVGQASAGLVGASLPGAHVVLLLMVSVPRTTVRTAGPPYLLRVRV